MNEYLMHRATDCPDCAGTEIVVRQSRGYARCYTCRTCQLPPYYEPRSVMGVHPCSLVVAGGYAAWVDTYLARVVASMWEHGFNTMFGCQGKFIPEWNGHRGYLSGIAAPGWLEHLRTLIDPATFIEIQRNDFYQAQPHPVHGENRTIVVRWEGSLAP